MAGRVRLRADFHDTDSIEDHAALIRQQVDKSVTDPETRRVAVAIASSNYDWINDPRTGRQTAAVQYHGRYYPIAPGQAQPAVCRARDYLCEIVAIWNFVVLNVRYTGDVDGYDTYQDLRTTLEAGGGDCDDMAVAFCALLRSLGYECAARVISLDGRYWAHVYPLVNHPKRGWIPLDATETGKKPGWEFGQAQAKLDFPMGD
jgi:hypothetical protein